jgi:hypothetical protein
MYLSKDFLGASEENYETLRQEKWSSERNMKPSLLTRVVTCVSVLIEGVSE